MKRIVMLAAACVIAVPAFAQNVATVNGKAIPQKSLDQFVKLLVSQGATDSPQLREQVKALELEAERELLGRLEQLAQKWQATDGAVAWLETLLEDRDARELLRVATTQT